MQDDSASERPSDKYPNRHARKAEPGAGQSQEHGPEKLSGKPLDTHRAPFSGPEGGKPDAPAPDHGPGRVNPPAPKSERTSKEGVGSKGEKASKPRAGASGKPEGKLQSKLPSKDITPVLKGWDYESGTINVRKVAGLDGLPKLQMRTNLGLMQMEMSGRPDGVRPHGCESLLEYFELQLHDYEEHNGSDLGFHLTGDQCESLREEALLYYNRYLSLFVLGELPGVVRDTARNLRVLDLCGKFAVEEHDRLVMEQYRPYIIMMNTKALASIQLEDQAYPKALATVNEGLDTIRAFFARFGQEEAFASSNEVKVLKRFGKEIRRKLPVDPVRRLQARLDRAVREERYEDAAKLRDEMLRRQAEKGE